MVLHLVPSYTVLAWHVVRHHNSYTACHLYTLQLTHDGQWLTTTDNQNTVRIWNTENLSSPAKQFTVQHPVEAASYCPSRNRFAAGGEDMWVHLHDADTGAELEVNKGHHGPVHTVRCGS